MRHAKIKTNLHYREISRLEDIDYFIETENYPINFVMNHSLLSRIQFPKSRAVLIRTSPYSAKVTVHIMRDVDLYSSFANFEVDLSIHEIKLIKEKGYISLTVTDGGYSND